MRDARRQLSTARMLLAQFIVQIDEFEALNREQRRTPRGRDLANRIDALRTGHATWTKNVTDLEAQIASQSEMETP
ncbi:hypothetical protein FB562_2211 [Homoserinimonas aerilata]|uniref:Uncharacterized protein n=1 Tax=Homoserinimonas aerilata TaxID=1162970 RepID=A0A542YF31_9MICO|nr:hypothetical protein [Homoserinimonas aerilata]TQL46687.1 hypothetical protein FB562_2211 [Homoserinimonas aerilata]